jgi:NADPH-ferrihemoprotein reductase
MRAFLQERRLQRQQGSPASVGATVLYVGCRRRSEDFIYEDEVMGYTQDGTITSLHTAFSREQEEKIYVQTLMGRTENSAEMWGLINKQGGHFYVCGGTGMGTDVMNAVIKTCETKGGMSNADATAYVKQLQSSGRYIQELWS